MLTNERNRGLEDEMKSVKDNVRNFATKTSELLSSGDVGVYGGTSE